MAVYGQSNAGDPYSGRAQADAYDARVAAAKAARGQQAAQYVAPQAGAPTGLSSMGGRVYAGDQRSFTDYGDREALERELATRDKYNQAAEARALAAMSQWNATGGGTAPTVSRVSGDIAQKESAARAAAFARSKEQAGAVAQSALSGLRNQMARRGFGGGGGFVDMRTAEALAPAADQLNEVEREQLIQDLYNAQHQGDVEYQGAIQQRGQTLANQPTAASLIGLLRAGRIY